MRDDRSSSTAQYIALARAWLTRAGVLDDPYAQRFLTRRVAMVERALWRARRTTVGQRAFAYLAARTRFYDALVTEALDTGITQVVIVAAGYDSRAWRLARPGVRFFEVDHPATQARKRTDAPPGGPTYAPADLAVTPLDHPLLVAGFNPAQPALFCCEGLTMYLTEPAVRELLGSAAALAASGSRLGVDFADATVGRRAPRRRLRAVTPALRTLTRAVARASGEPIVFELDPEDAPSLLRARGWEPDEVLTGPELHDRFLADDEMRVRWAWAAAFVARASVVDSRGLRSEL